MNELRKVRKAKQMSLAELAAKVGVSEGQLSRIERGESGVSLATAAALENETGIPASSWAPRPEGRAA